MSHSKKFPYSGQSREQLSLRCRIARSRSITVHDTKSTTPESILGRDHAVRCELSDLAIVTYSNDSRSEIGLSFLQAKRSAKQYIGPLRAPSRFDANLEQWDLLCRAIVQGHSSFDIPQDLLRGALLQSIGSFGIFYRHRNGSVQFYYKSADTLYPIAQPSNNSHPLTAHTVPNLGGYLAVRVSSSRVSTFCLGLAGLAIGRPFTPRPD